MLSLLQLLILLITFYKSSQKPTHRGYEPEVTLVFKDSSDR